MTNAKFRCAIYTRKSSDEGLEQQFNSLNAQREACEAYIQSQAHEGWRLIPTEYDDGGMSGATMDRAALQRLLADVDAGLVDTIVVYKIDRLTRSLADFARIVERLDARGTSFVSVTQAFNTTSSMGRLTLNVLLSFAQFEREVTGERIRDKIAASKKRGLWMGGVPPLGYDLPEPGSRTLRLNPTEASLVQTIFESYRELGSVHVLQRSLAAQGIVSKTHVSRTGQRRGGGPYSRGALFHLLRNRLYLGLIVHKGCSYPGEHPPIIGSDLFDAVQAMLTAHTRRGSTDPSRSRAVRQGPLTGRLFDGDGQPLSPTHSRGARGKLYCYYVSTSLQQGRPRLPDDPAVRRVSATALETWLETTLARLLPETRTAERLACVIRIEIRADTLDLLLPVRLQPTLKRRLEPDETMSVEPMSPQAVRLTLPVCLTPRCGRTVIEGGTAERIRCDPVLIQALRRAHGMLRIDEHGLPVLDASPASFFGRRLVRLALLAPTVQQAILAGTQPPALTLSQFLRSSIPLAWSAQQDTFA